ncbi:MAG: hypothetical protein HY842_03745 [Bacteroidetes bacterium]|nr:hypothetical protein [Bacteroidota bacterium]
MELIQKKSIGTTIVNGVFLIVLNLVLMSIIGYLTLDSDANPNSRIGAFLLSFFIPIFIVYKTRNMDAIERMLKFGFGFISYIILSLIMVGFPQAFVTGLIPCLVVALATLYYGKVAFEVVE